MCNFHKKLSEHGSYKKFVTKLINITEKGGFHENFPHLNYMAAKIVLLSPPRKVLDRLFRPLSCVHTSQQSMTPTTQLFNDN